LNLSAEVRWVCRLPLGAGFFHGPFRLVERWVDLGMPESRCARGAGQ